MRQRQREDMCGAKHVVYWGEAHPADGVTAVVAQPMVLYCTLNRRHKGKHLANVAWDRKEKPREQGQPT